jgi:hypothetical protein
MINLVKKTWKQLKDSFLDIGIIRLIYCSFYEFSFYGLFFASFYIFALLLRTFSESVPIPSKEQVYDPVQFDAFYNLFNLFLFKGLGATILFLVLLIILFGILKGLLFDTLTGNGSSTKRLIGYVKVTGIIIASAFFVFIFSFIIRLEIRAYLIVLFYILLIPVTLNILIQYAKEPKLKSIIKGIKKSHYLVLSCIIIATIYALSRIIILLTITSENLSTNIFSGIATIICMTIFFVIYSLPFYFLKRFTYAKKLFMYTTALFFIFTLYLLSCVTILFHLISFVRIPVFVYSTTAIITIIYFVWARFFLIRIMDTKP